MVRSLVPSRELVVRVVLFVLHAVAVLLGFGLLFYGTLWSGAFSGLSTIRATIPLEDGLVARTLGGDGVFDLPWYRSTLEVAVGFCLVPKRRPRGRVDATAMVVVVLALLFMLFFIDVMAGAGTYGTCVYKGCWPVFWDGLAAALPFMVAVVLLGVMSCYANRLNVWWRRLVPPVVYFVGMVVLALVWDPWLFPFFAGPPPW